MTPADAALLARIEDAGLNASAPREQRWVDGWLLRTAPGKAKRARCVQPVAAGHGPIDTRLARCVAAFAAAGLPAFVRISPFAEPPDLDERLATLGWTAVDHSIVMSAPVDRVGSVAHGVVAATVEPVDAAEFCEWIGAGRGSTAEERRSHADRVASSPVAHRAWWLREPGGRVVAGGQVAIEDDLAGLYDVHTEAACRGRGIATALCAGLVREAAASGVRTAYLQVDARNAPALAVYDRLGFTEGYRYHYRTPTTA